MKKAALGGFFRITLFIQSFLLAVVAVCCYPVSDWFPCFNGKIQGKIYFSNLI